MSGPDVQNKTDREALDLQINRTADRCLGLGSGHEWSARTKEAPSGLGGLGLRRPPAPNDQRPLGGELGARPLVTLAAL
jgi:hypothetical protein